MRKATVLFVVLLFSAATTLAQVSINKTGAAADGSAMLDVSSTTLGFLPPRMTEVQMNAIASPAVGLIVFCTDCTPPQPYFFNGICWVQFIGYLDGPAFGSTYTNHYNGITAGVSVDYTLASYTTGETFNNNLLCICSLISAQGCGGITSVTGASGTVYNVADINGQCWMTENLNELVGGIAINASEWLNTTVLDHGYDGYYNIVLGTGEIGWGLTEPAAGEGMLYQWSGAMNFSTVERAQGLCPTGWHIPSDCEWMYLEHGQGMSISEQIGVGWRSNAADNQGTPGNKLRSAGTGATNASGFSALLAGYRATWGGFVYRSTWGVWWSSTATDYGAYDRILRNDYRGVARHDPNTGAYGNSVRCLKD